MRKITHALLLLAMLLSVAVSFPSCVDEEEMSDTPRGNVEALWKIVNERYCFFDYKRQAYGLDWDEVHDR